MHTLDGRPYIESETTTPQAIEDRAGAIPRDQVEADPALREALAAWERKDDSSAAIDHVGWFFERYGMSIVIGAEDAKDGVTLAEGVDDPWCATLREALPHLTAAAAIIEPVHKAVREALEERGKKARAERGAEAANA